MPSVAVSDIETALKTFASSVTSKFNLQVDFQPEDQLKSPIESLLVSIGDALGLPVLAVTEVRAPEFASRPDVGVTQGGLLTGHIELKAPGLGADAKRFRGRNKDQWEKFKNFPNLIYTDGNEWTLYHTGEFVMSARLGGDVRTDGANAVNAQAAQSLLAMMRDFLQWEPTPPRNAKDLAKFLAPICGLLRDAVTEALQEPRSALVTLAQDWRASLFPDADDEKFADAYAQTLTYAMLLARLEGLENLTVGEAAQTLRGGHALLAQTLKVLGDDEAKDQIAGPVALMERIIRAVDPAVLTRPGQEDPWLYFYEDFLAAYDPKLRRDYGVYYTPVQVVQAQVCLVAELLKTHFDADHSFVDPHVVTLDPAVGTGTYILAAVKHGLDQIADERGPGARKSAATLAAKNIHAFEFLVGPYAVAHLRLTQQIKSEGGQMPADGVHVYLADTLESPHGANNQRLPLGLRRLGEEHERARTVKNATSVMVCIGNPPYDREQREDVSGDAILSNLAAGNTFFAQPTGIKGGWVRFGDGKNEGTNRRFRLGGADNQLPPLLEDFLAPLRDIGSSKHAKNLYNDYVYFWRWALWKVFETTSDGGIVSFITASSYLRGPGFAGMRRVMRETFDELYIIDLEGDNLGARKTENVFAIQTPVCIAVGYRKGAAKPDLPARVYYTRIEGNRAAKLDALANVTDLNSLTWEECPDSWHTPFLPISNSEYHNWPRLTNLFPWQVSGMQFKRSWPIGESPDLLRARWSRLVTAPATARQKMLKETGARTIQRSFTAIDGTENILPALASLSANSEPVPPERYAFRSFDRQWMLRDKRLCDAPKLNLLSAHSEKQIYLTSLLSEVLGEGTAATATAYVPDLHHFRGSFGGAHVIPLWRDAEATQANITSGVLDTLKYFFTRSISAEDLLAYAYAALSTPDYVRRFWEELRAPGPRLPITKNADLFARMSALGRELLWRHTFGERFTPDGQRPGRVPQGRARNEVGTSGGSSAYPEKFAYNAQEQKITVGAGAGAGVFSHVRPEVWEYSVSGLQVVKSWLGYRMKKRKGKKSSPLDDIRPSSWTFDNELLDLLWTLDGTVDLLPQVTSTLGEILSGELFLASEFAAPTAEEQRGPRTNASSGDPLALALDEDEESSEDEDEQDEDEGIEQDEENE